MSDVTKVEKFLRRNTKTPGITPEKLARLTGLSKDSVYKRVGDLRDHGMPIYSNYRIVKGKRTMFYRMAA